MSERKASMGDKVYRGDVIKFIRNNISLGTFMKRTVKTADEACWDLCDKLNYVPAIEERPEPHWIPVTKDLPKESGHYIVTTRTVCLPINLLHPELDRYSNNVRIDYFRAYDNKFDLPSTVAWWSEPLPEPYEGVTE